MRVRGTGLPPEDCGGGWPYADFVETIQNPDDEGHEELLE